jgi:microsomal dipeptidase-like Zn-dependent dipeptidase
MDKIICTDLHCDLLSYLQEAPQADPMIGGRIGCTIPDLMAGNVKFQVMAIYCATQKGSVNLALQQAFLFNDLINNYSRYFKKLENDIIEAELTSSTKINIITAIENASGICEEDEPIESSFNNLENIIKCCGKPFYLGLTHHGENRFGGGNATKDGLKEDGRQLINFLAEKKMALDFSHASDNLAADMLNYISKNNLKISILASHSNFRKVYHHLRNLPDEIAKEIIDRNGLIGINLLRAFLNPLNENALYEHIEYGLKLGASNNLALGADYFYCDSHPDQTRIPFFFANHDNASKYEQIIENISSKFGNEVALKFASHNTFRFLKEHALK